MIKYKAGYKYQLAEDYSLQTVFRPAATRRLEYTELNADGLLTIFKGYSWDGPSGPTFDTKNFMRGSLVHDALYELIYHELLPYDAKITADHILVTICEDDGMSTARCWWVLKGVEIGGDPRPSRIKPVITAP